MPDLFNNAFDGLYGNGGIKEYFNDAIKRGTLSHSYIFEGEYGSGKHTLSFELAAAMAPEYAEKILAGNEPDVALISHAADKKTIGVDVVRDMKDRSRYASNELDFKLFIIEDADTMTTQAQNSLLKLLEEPPRGVYMLLLCSNVNGLLPTVVSRAPVLRMQLFEDEELSAYLCKTNKKAAELYKNDRAAFDFAVRTSGGRIGEALRRIQSRSKTASGGAYGAVGEMLNMLAEGRRADFYCAAAAIPSKREEADIIFTCLEEASRDLLLAKSTDGKPPKGCTPMFFADTEEAVRIASGFTNAALRTMTRELTELHEKLDMNANIRLIGAVFADRIWKAVRS